MVLSAILLPVVSIVSVVALVTTIVAVAIPVWDNTSTEVTVTRVVTQHVYSGIWSTCSFEEVKDYSSYTCDRITDGDDSLKAVQAMTLMGSMLCAGAVICIFLKCCIFKDNKILGIAIIIMCITAGVFLIIGASVFAGNVSLDINNLNAGFGLTIIAAALIIVTAVIMLCLVCCDK